MKLAGAFHLNELKICEGISEIVFFSLLEYTLRWKWLLKCQVFHSRRKQGDNNTQLVTCCTNISSCWFYCNTQLLYHLILSANLSMLSLTWFAFASIVTLTVVSQQLELLERWRNTVFQRASVGCYRVWDSTRFPEYFEWNSCEFLIPVAHPCSGFEKQRISEQLTSYKTAVSVSWRLFCW